MRGKKAKEIRAWVREYCHFPKEAGHRCISAHFGGQLRGKTYKACYRWLKRRYTRGFVS